MNFPLDPFDIALLGLCVFFLSSELIQGAVAIFTLARKRGNR